MKGTSKPTVFVSSTISDFQDLRGALRFWLEEGGFEVWLSEYNDMEKSPGANAFDACFETIRKADFYILLIGKRKGSLYDAKDDVSVTQQEYRVAYSAFSEQGRPIPILFIRSQVKDVLDAWPRNDNRPPFEDAVFVRNFVSEVTREQLTTDAVHGIGPYPLANWLHRFHDFKDVIDALRVALLLKVDVPLRKLLASMELDLEVTLSSLVDKHQYRPQHGGPIWENLTAYGLSEDEVKRIMETEIDVPFPCHWYLCSVTKEIPLKVTDQSSVRLNRQQTIRLPMYLGGGLVNPDLMSFGSVRDAVVSGALLRYDPQTRAFQETGLSLAASELLREGERYETDYKHARSVQEELMERLASANRLKDSEFKLGWVDAVNIWAFYHSQVNLYRCASSLYAYLKDKKDSPLPDSLLPITPLGAEMEAEIKRERATKDDIRAWSALPQFWNL